MTTPDFIPGLELSRRFYHEAVLPVLETTAPGVPHSAARIGSGSEVLGFDTPRSADHEWGPRLQLFLAPEDIDRHGPRIADALSHQLPKTFHGYPTNFTPVAEGSAIGFMEVTDGPVRHRVDIAEPDDWMRGQLGFVPPPAPGSVGVEDWLATPTQRLAEVVGGAVFHDGLGRLEPARAGLAWYPHDLWLYVLSCQWKRISQEEAFVGRCGEVGDELGSAVTAARLVRELMRLVLLMDRRFPPYGKWLGSAFAATAPAASLTPHLSATLAATDWKTRQSHLGHAYEAVAARHNELALTEPVDPRTRRYFGRPFRVLRADRFADALGRRITDPQIRALPPTGTADQFADSTDFLGDLRRTRLSVSRG